MILKPNVPEAGAPCFYCGVRTDVACRHRPAQDRIVVEVPPDGRRDRDMRADVGKLMRYKARLKNKM